LGRIMSGGGRPAWYDRNPVNRAIDYNASAVGPHAVTDRATYTVPAGKKALVENISLLVMRDGSPTTAGRAWAIAMIYPGGGAGWTALSAIVLSATVGATDHAEVGTSALLQATDVIKLRTEDLSTAGTHFYALGLKITEFDA